MRIASHARLLAQVVFAWAGFWVLGLPGYYKQYPTAAVAVGAVLLSSLVSLLSLWILLRMRPEHRISRAAWLSVYFTVPFAVLDTLYCGLYPGHGSRYLSTYWYLTVFYVSPWITLIPTAVLLRGVSALR